MPPPGKYKLLYGPWNGRTVEVNGASKIVAIINYDDYYKVITWDYQLCEITYSFNYAFNAYVFESVSFPYELRYKRRAIKGRIVHLYSDLSLKERHLLMFEWHYFYKRNGEKIISGSFLFSREMLRNIDFFCEAAEARILHDIKHQKYERKKAARKAKREGEKG